MGPPPRGHQPYNDKGFLNPLHLAVRCRPPRTNENRLQDCRFEHKLMKYVARSPDIEDRVGRWGPMVFSFLD